MGHVVFRGVALYRGFSLHRVYGVAYRRMIDPQRLRCRPQTAMQFKCFDVLALTVRGELGELGVHYANSFSQ
jgi:hypothetical protein